MHWVVGFYNVDRNVVYNSFFANNLTNIADILTDILTIQNIEICHPELLEGNLNNSSEISIYLNGSICKSKVKHFFLSFLKSFQFICHTSHMTSFALTT